MLIIAFKLDDWNEEEPQEFYEVQTYSSSWSSKISDRC